MHDGVVRTLIEVCHISELKKRFIFVGFMDSKGFSCWVKGGVLNIRRKGKFVVMQGTKQGNLYILQGYTVIGFVSTISQSRSLVSNGSSSNSLWHLHLAT